MLIDHVMAFEIIEKCDYETAEMAHLKQKSFGIVHIWLGLDRRSLFIVMCFSSFLFFFLSKCVMRQAFRIENVCSVLY